jgi:hypothetical protein
LRPALTGVGRSRPRAPRRIILRLAAFAPFTGYTLKMRIRAEGLVSLVAELRQQNEKKAA